MSSPWRRPLFLVFALSLFGCGDGDDVGATSTAATETTGAGSTTDETTDPGTTAAPPCGADWYDDAWASRMWVSIDNSAGTTDLDNFVVLVNFAGMDLEGARPDGADLRFRDADNNEMRFALDSWDSSVGGVAWVQLPTLAAGDAIQGFYLYYGQPGGSFATTPAQVWENTRAVFHMGQVVDGMIEAEGPNDITGVAEGTTSVTGQISLARRFVGGQTSRIDFGAGSDELLSGWGALSFSMWVLADYDADADWVTAGRLVERGDALVGGQLRRDESQAPDLGMFELDFGYGDGFNQAVTMDVPRQQWTWIGVDFDGSQVRMYRDGAQVNETAAVGDAVGAGAGSLVFGGDGDSFTGVLDEVRVYDASQSAAWYDAQYRSMTGAMISFGDVETCDG